MTSFATIPHNAKLAKLVYRNIKNPVPLISKPTTKSINSVGVRVKEFIPMIEHVRLGDMDLTPISSSHFGSRTNSFRVRQPIFKKPFTSRAGFSIEDVKLLENISDPNAKALALATMERVFRLDAIFKNDKHQHDTPFKMLSLPEQEEAKMYLSELQSTLVAIQNSKTTASEIQANTTKAVNHYVQQIRNIIKTKNNQPG
jgi:hypothetical protein